jgi:hypothetical protein
MSMFASETPTYSYDPRGDTLYIEYSRDQAERTVEILNGWPMLLVNPNLVPEHALRFQHKGTCSGPES